MVFIIAWLHSKSSAKAWEQFVKNQAKILAGGSVLCLGGLAFLAVFREGAETILFYAAMLPKTEIAHFSGGLILGAMVLGIFAYFMDYITKKIPMRHIFRVMSLLLYALDLLCSQAIIKTITPTATMPTKPSKISLSTSALSSDTKVAKSTAATMLSTTPSPAPKLIATLAFVLVFKAASFCSNVPPPPDVLPE